jgi:hypothetical protein
MKNVLWIALLLLSILSYGQNSVDVQQVSQTSTTYQIKLIPNQYQTSVLSNVVFTLRWRTSQNIAIGNPSSNNYVAIYKSGPVRSNSGWNYQVYSGFGFTTVNINQEIQISIPKSGRGKIYISDDTFTNQINGSYYVSIGGENVTGSILSTSNLQGSTAKQVQEIDEFESTIILYFDPFSRQFYMKREGVFYDVLGRKANINNVDVLIEVRKKEI